MEEFSVDSGKIWAPKGDSYDEVYISTGQTIQEMMAMSIKLIVDQIDDYQVILVELEKKNKSNIKTE